MPTLRDLRLERNLRLEDVALPLRMTVAALSRLERGLSKPRAFTLEKLADFYDIPYDEITDYLPPQHVQQVPIINPLQQISSEEPAADPSLTDGLSDLERIQIEAYKTGLISARHFDQAVRIPIIGETAAGFGSSAASEWTGDYASLPSDCLHGNNVRDFFALHVRGESMNPFIMDGDIAIFRRQDDVQSGDLALVVYGDDLDAVGSYGTLKQIRKEADGGLSLVALNQDYETLTLRGDDLASVRIQGRLMQIVRKF